eukprot:TRINITY_DN66837_c4_g1_i1.p2 TRINITY_DN66837_c4_g1~~TRINITY_DN66837_c4_g1_i1.p2  ORF type:complete len:225 (+),score=127.02 TRINITY_DN66837_c4_g1_i1:61-735(+)
MSMRKGNRKKKGPKYQNQFAFRHNKHSKLSERIMNLPNVGLCRRCTEKIEWRKRYRKYKVPKEPTHCVSCKQRNVLYPYHVLCEACAREKKVCAKCQEPGPLVRTFDDIDDSHSGGMTVEQVTELLASYAVKERNRRAIIREMEKGELYSAQLRKFFKRWDDPDDKEVRGEITLAKIRKTLPAKPKQEEEEHDDDVEAEDDDNDNNNNDNNNNDNDNDSKTSAE